MVSVLAFSLSVLGLVTFTTTVAAFDNTRFDNVAVYWGQNSFGATHTDTTKFQKPINFYCADNAIDVLPVAFLTAFFDAGGLPSLNLANTCNGVDNATFPGSDLPNCQALASDIQACQAKGKLVTLSLGGASGGVGFSSDAQAKTFADQIWNLFLGGTSSTRPFGSAVLDGVDLDIEGGGSAGYVAFVNQLRSHFNGASKSYFITAAPQCPFPDGNLGGVLNGASFDAVYVQFYNNQCGLNNFATTSDWDFGVWDNWARTISPNPKVKIYIGAPADTTAAGSGYVSAASLASIAKQMRNSFPSFGGVMLWDASQAFANNRYDLAIKNALVAAGGTGFTFPPCTAPAFVQGTSYTGGSQVSFNGYIWQANFFADQAPTSAFGGEWSAISACSGGAGAVSSSPASTHSTSSSTSSSKSSTVSSTTSSASPTPTTGSCAGVPAWSSTVAFPGGSQVVSGGHLWTAKFWSEADIPGGTAGDWTDDGPCTTANVVSVGTAKAATALASPAKASPEATPAKAAKTTARSSRAFRF